jgi:hypothetical protein
VTVARVRLSATPAPEQPLLVALNVLNPNDYDIATQRVELALALDDTPVGRLDRDSNVAVEHGATITVALPLRPDDRSRTRLGQLTGGTHRFMIEGRATFVTPIGKRKVRFAQVGEMAFDSSASPASAPADRGGSP